MGVTAQIPLPAVSCFPPRCSSMRSYSKNLTVWLTRLAMIIVRLAMYGMHYALQVDLDQPTDNSMFYPFQVRFVSLQRHRRDGQFRNGGNRLP